MAKTPAKDDQKDTNTGIAEIEKKFGKGIIQRYDSKVTVPCETIPTGHLGLDIALGVGGIPRGRVIEIFGPESSGKTTLALHILASAQKQGQVAAFIDAEHALDPQWAKKLGVKLEDLYISQPDCAEQALEIAEMLVTGSVASFIVIDSVAALIPRAEIEGDMGDSHMGLQARLMSQALRKLTGVLSRGKATIIFINQIREKIGVMFGSPETTTGGRALKFFSSIRHDIRRTASITVGEVKVGNKTRVKVVKNKVAPPFRETEAEIYFGNPVSGFDGEASIITEAVEHGIVEKSGSWFNAGAVRLGMGQVNAANYLRANPDIAADLRSKVLAATRPESPASPAPRDLTSPPETFDIGTGEIQELATEPEAG